MGLGNQIRGDDAIGIILAKKIRDEIGENNIIDIKDTEVMGLSLLDFISGYEEVILIDSIQTLKVPTGTVLELNEKDLKSLSGLSPHFVGIPEILAIGASAGLKIPSKIKIFAIEVKDPYTITTTLSEELSTKIPSIVKRIKDYIIKAIKNYQN